MPRRPAPLTIRLLGPLEVAVSGRPIVVDTRKALAIVALIASEGRPFARDELAAIFWPESDDEAARGALRRTLSSLRTAVGDIGIVIGRAHVALDPAASSVDLADLERLAASTRSVDLEAAAVLARGPFLAGFALRDSPAFDDWQATRAARVERTVGSVLQRLSDARLEAGDAEGAVDAARRRVELDPLDEVGQRRLIGLLARAGDRAAAIRQYRELVALFDRELGVAPLRETTDLYDAIREGGQEVVATSPHARLSAGVGVVDATGSTAPLVGRTGELAAIGSAWRAARPDGRVVLLEGEAGIGKTRLAEAAAVAVRTDGGVVLSARAYPGETAIAYGPIAELVRLGLAMPGATARLAGLDDTIRLEIGRMVDLPAPLRVAGAGKTVSADGAGARVRLLDAIARVVSALVTGPLPGLVWVDDLHLADDSTREALAYIARRLTGRSLLVLLAWRREDLTDSGRATADDLGRIDGATRLSLGRLERDEIAAIVRASRPDDGVDDSLIDAYAADSEGLPLHVVAALASGEPPGGPLPRGVHSLLRERIESVGETATQILSAAAVIGRSFDLATLRGASGRSEGETIDGVEELMRRGIVREVPGPVGPSVLYDFAHARMRDVAYESTSLARRRLLHRRTAAALTTEQSLGGRDDLTRYSLIAAHEREAGRPVEAAAAFREAADRAESVFANREAIDHLASAIALGDPDGAAAHARIGELRARLGEYPAAIASLETAAALVEPADLPAVEIALGRVHRRRGDLAAAASHLGSALASPDLTGSLRARALVERSVVALRAGDLEIAGDAASAVDEVASRLADRHLSGVAARLLGLVALGRGDARSARETLQRAVELAADDADPTASIAASTGLALACAAAGSIGEAIDAATVAIGACRRIGDRHLEAAVENHLADILHEAGREDDSMVHLKRAVALFAEVGDRETEQDPGIWTLAAW
jgi:DNA-binding SARP family transcriptional activator/tetratricopeptide (TPR) repeat protein